MAKYTTFNGYKVLAGVKWIVDKKSITITCHPKRTDGGRFPFDKDKPYTNTWKNYCPKCGVSGKCTGIGQGKGEFGLEGGVRCNACDADYCGVSGLDTRNNRTRVRLTKASSSSNSSITNKLSDLKAKKEKALNEIKKEYNENKLPKKNMILKLPLLPNFKDGYCHKLSPPLISKDLIVFVESVEISQEGITSQVNDKLEPPGEEYKPPENSKNNQSASNYNASSEIEKKIMAIGESLKKSTDTETVRNIYNNLETRGKLGFSYAMYYDWPGGDINKLNKTALAKRWEKKSGNCVFFAWAFYVMCQGAGVTVEIWHATAQKGLLGHLYNRYKGNVYDCTHYRNHAKSRKIK